MHRRVATISSRIVQFYKNSQQRSLSTSQWQNLYQLVKYSLINSRNWIMLWAMAACMWIWHFWQLTANEDCAKWRCIKVCAIFFWSTLYITTALTGWRCDIGNVSKLCRHATADTCADTCRRWTSNGSRAWHCRPLPHLTVALVQVKHLQTMFSTLYLTTQMYHRGATLMLDIHCVPKKVLLLFFQ